MANYVDEKIAKITLDNKAFNENAKQTLSVLDKLKAAFSKLGDGANSKGIQKSMNDMSSSVERSSQKTTGILAKLKSVFKKSNEEFDMSGASKSVDKMNTDIANKTARTSDILSRLKGIFQKADSGIDFQNTTSSIDKLNNKVSTFDASGLSVAFEKALSSVNNSLSMMDIALGNVMGNMIQKSMGFANQFTSGWRDGLAEYTNKMNSIQTIKSNTESAFGGDTNRQMVQINRTLADLNEYADQTIYSFEDMTRNIGTFTAAGVGLEDSAIAIKGIANLAAASGSSSMQASTAMYQLSQALASGRVNLMDWNSVVNAGMGGEVFKNALMETAEAMGVNVDRTKTFRDTLQDGWLTSEVLLATLKKFSTNESMIDAATKVKTFGQLIDTTKEAIGSGWAETWEHIFGGLEEAKGLWSGVAKEIGSFLDDNQGKFFDTVLQMERNLGNFRNAMFKTWKDGGGQKAFFEGITNSVKILMTSMDSLRQGFRSVMGDYKEQANVIIKITTSFQRFTEAILKNTQLQETLRSVGSAVASVLKTLGSIIGTVFGGFSSANGNMLMILKTIERFANGINSFFESIRSNSNVMSAFSNIGKTLGNVWQTVMTLFQIGATIVSQFLSAFNLGDGSGFLSFSEILFKISESMLSFTRSVLKFVSTNNIFKSFGSTLSAVFGVIGNTFSSLFKVLSGNKLEGLDLGINGFIERLGNKISEFGPTIIKGLQGLGSGISTSFKFIIDTFQKLDLGSIIAGVFSYKAISTWIEGRQGGFFKTLIDAYIIKPWEKAKEDLESFKDKIKGILDGFSGVLNGFTKTLNMTSLLLTAAAIGILALSMKTLADLDMKDLSEGMIGIGSAALILVKAFKVLSALGGIPKGLPSSMIAFAIAVRILAGAMKKISEIEEGKLLSSTAALATAVASLTLAMKSLSKSGKIEVGAMKMIGFAIAVRILASALYKISEIDSNRLLGSLGSLVTIMGTLALVARSMNNIKLRMGILTGLIGFALSVRILVSSLSKISELNPDRLGGSLVSLVTIMTTLAGVSRIMNGIKIRASAMFGLIVFSGSMYALVDQLGFLASLNANDMLNALSGLEIIMFSLVGIMKLLQNVKINLSIMGGLIVFSGSMYVLTESLSKIATINPSRLLPSLLAMETVMFSIAAIVKMLTTGRVNVTGAIVSMGMIANFAVLLKQVGSTLTQLAYLETDKMYNAIIGLGLVFAELAIFSRLIDGLKTDGLMHMVAYSLLLYSVGTNISKLAAFSWPSLLGAVKALGSVLAMLVVSSMALSKISVKGSANLVILAAALMAIAPPLKLLSTIPWAGVASGLTMLGASLAILVAAGALAGLVAPGLSALSAALASFGFSAMTASIAFSLAGFGMLAFASAIAILGTTAGTAFVNIVKGFGLMIQQIAIMAPMLMTNMIMIIRVALKGLAILIPEFVQFAIDIVANLCKGLADSAPRLITEGVRLITELAKSLMDNIDILVKTGLELAITFIESLSTNLMTLKDRLIPALTELFSVILDVLMGVLDGLLGPLLNKIVEILTPVGEFIISMLTGLASAIAPVLMPIAMTLMTLFQTIASVITDIANVVIALIQGIETVVNGFVTIVTSILTTIQSAFESFSSVVGSIAGVITTAINGVVAIVQQIAVIISATFNGIAQTIMAAGVAIQSVLQGIGSMFQSVGSAIQSVLQGIGSVIESFGTSVKSILEGVGKAFESVGTGIKTAMEGVGTVIEKIGGSIRTVLDGIAGIFDSIGKAALNAGKGFEKIADGVSQILQYSLGELVSNLGAVADAIIKISAQSAGMQTAGTGLRSIGSALTTFSTAGMTAVTVLQSLASTLPIISAAMLTLPGPTQQVAMSMQQLALGIMGMAAPLQMVSVSITAFSTGMTMLGTAMVSVVPSITMFQTTLNMIPAGLTMVSAAITSVGSVATMLGSQFTTTASMSASAFMSISSTAVTTFGMLASTISSGMTTATNAIRGGMQQMTAAITQSMNQSRSIVQSSMTQMTSTIRSQGQQMVSIARTMGQQVGQNITNGIRSATGPVSSAMVGLVNAVRGQAGNGQSGGHYVGSMIGQGVAQGMWSAVGSVQAAANAIINAANAAARAKAQIHSPSRLFAKTVGRFIPEGVAMGIDKFAHTAIDSTVAVIDGMADGAGRAVTTMGENLSNLTTGAMGIVTDVINNALESDLDFSPTISPVVDLDNLKKLDTIASNAEIKMGAIPSLSLPSTDRYQRVDPSSYGNTTTNTSETNISITVEMDGTPNPKEFAQQVSREMKRALDAQRMSKGDPVY